MNELAAPPKEKPIRLNRKQLMFMDLWTDPASQTFGNVYKSGLAAGFAPTYARNIANVAPQWLLSNIDKTDLKEEHIKQGVQRIATGEINSKSVDDTRLKAYEMLARFNGMLDTKTSVNVAIVQPILGGASVKKNSTVIDQT